MPFGSKKGGDEDLSLKKASLFGKSSSKLQKSPPPTQNPYAVPAPANDPYASRNANPYANQANAKDPYAPSQPSYSQPPTQSFGNMSLNNNSGGFNGNSGGFQNSCGQAPQPNRYEKSPVPAGGYGGAPTGGASSRYQSQGSYGQGGGYGGDAYGTAPPQYQSRKGGYGGMGSYDQDTDAGRSALFGDAPTRAAQHQAAPQQQGYGSGGGDSSYNNSGGYDASDLHGGYGAPPPDRELTAEEIEDQDVNATKQEIRFIKQQDVASTRNARRIAEQSEQIGRETLQRLGAQGERIHNTERNLDMASSQNVLAEEKARELKTLNRSMFAVHVNNPFTTKKREEAASALALEKNQQERNTREATQAAAYSSQQRQEEQQRKLNGQLPLRQQQKNLAERTKYQFEADSEDEDMENEIDDNLDAIHRSAKTLNALGKAMGDEIESQNKHLGRVIDKTDRVDDQIAVNRARLDRIK